MVTTYGSGASAVLLRGGKIWTGNPRAPRAEALLWYGSSLEAVGSEEEVRQHPLASKAQVVSLRGETVLPGMTDAHAHLGFYAKQRSALPLDQCSSLDEVKTLIRQRSALVGPDAWICGVRFNDTRWAENRLPTRQDLDSMDIPNPVLLSRVCCHVQVANSRGLLLAGFAPDAAPTGILYEGDGDPVVQAVERDRKPEAYLRCLQEVCQEYTSYGVTSVHTCSAGSYGLGDDLATYQSMLLAGTLPLRIVFYTDDMPPPGFLSGLGNEWVRFGGFKLFLDGSLGGHTAALSAPYADDPSTTGMFNHETRALIATMREAHRRGFQMEIHAIGDAALDQAIEALGALRDLGPCRAALPHRVNHVMICRPDQLEPLRALGVILDVQPVFVPGEIDMATARLGRERLSWAYPWKTFVDGGFVVTGSSDCPVEMPTPWRGIWGAVCRTDEAGNPAGGWIPEQKLSLDEALTLFTVNPALAVGEGRRRGRLAPGFLADVVVCGEDLFALSPDKLKDVLPRATLVGGRLASGELEGVERLSA